MKDEYLKENQVNVSIGYYVYDNRLFDKCIEEIMHFETLNDTDKVKVLSKEMIEKLTNDFGAIKSDEEFRHFYRSISTSDSAEKYIDLYHALSLSKLQKVMNGDFSFDQDKEDYENYIYFRDCYLRMKSSFYFERSWFIPYSYRLTDGFLKLLVEKKDMANIYNNKSVEYDSLFFNLKIDHLTIKNIIKKVKESNFDLSDLTIQDRYFYKALENALDNRVLIVYKTD